MKCRICDMSVDPRQLKAHRAACGRAKPPPRCWFCHPDEPTTDHLCPRHYADAHDLIRWDET